MRRTLTRLGLLAAIAAALLAVAGVATRPHRSPAAEPLSQAAVEPASAALADRVARAQQRLRDLPGDWTGWAALGAVYLEQARVTADPALYPKAERAAQRSLALRRAGNGDALVVLGALANARHDFAAARDRARAALLVDDHDAGAYGVLADALTQLGDAAGATGAVQRMLDLRPGLAAYARASYDLELRGRLAEATALMRRALTDAVDRHDAAFCRTQLGDLAFGRGDLDSAATEYAAALAADPTAIAAQRGRARVRAARGDLSGALADYADLTARLPGPSYLIEYAELLNLTGRTARANEQLVLAAAAQRLFTANGGRDDLSTAALALAEGHPAEAVTAARAEWARRRHPDVADTLAWSLHLAGHDTEALGYARQAISGASPRAGSPVGSPGRPGFPTRPRYASTTPTGPAGWVGASSPQRATAYAWPTPRCPPRASAGNCGRIRAICSRRRRTCGRPRSGWLVVVLVAWPAPAAMPLPLLVILPEPEPEPLPAPVPEAVPLPVPEPVPLPVPVPVPLPVPAGALPVSVLASAARPMPPGRTALRPVSPSVLWLGRAGS